MTGKDQLLDSLKKLLPPSIPDPIPTDQDQYTERLAYIEAHITWLRRVVLALAAIVAYLVNKVLALGLDLDHLIAFLTAALK